MFHVLAVASWVASAIRYVYIILLTINDIINPNNDTVNYTLQIINTFAGFGVS